MTQKTPAAMSNRSLTAIPRTSHMVQIVPRWMANSVGR